jgi:hypothetical protein
MAKASGYESNKHQGGSKIRRLRWRTGASGPTEQRWTKKLALRVLGGHVLVKQPGAGVRVLGCASQRRDLTHAQLIGLMARSTWISSTRMHKNTRGQCSIQHVETRYDGWPVAETKPGLAGLANTRLPRWCWRVQKQPNGRWLSQSQRQPSSTWE